ncbi:MAG: 2-oxoglutarate dehydrogenase E1 component [Chlamydiae bacterium]|nr:2-oxoglutarate dehydrogenase E1 component [Chlamydiota bacterium]
MVDKAISYAHLGNLTFIEELYGRFLQDPTSVDSSWRYFFEGMEFSKGLEPGPAPAAQTGDLKAYLLVQAYRMYGHLAAQIDPLSDKVREPEPLSLSTFGLTEDDLSASFSTFGFLAKEKAPLKELIASLKATYANKVGIEYLDLGNLEMEKFIQKKIEPSFPINLTVDDRLQILHYLNKAEFFETFIHTKYVGQKRFSLEGAETLIPMLGFIIDKGADLGVQEVALGMAHRGRLNVLANILNKSYSMIFHEFEDHYSNSLGQGTGDVKYHKGFQGALKTHSGKEVFITLAANPSHLESVDPLVEGRAKAVQEIKGGDFSKALPILIHGDASVAGQGVVYETLQLSRVPGYATGGTIHIVINNQIGFTTLPSEARSTKYCTDIAKAFNCPVFHVNAEDPESCIRAAILSIELRHRFGCDVFIDLNCYRKYGHNEGDEPAFTQPLQYNIIRAKKSIRELFKLQLIQEGVLTPELSDQKEAEFKSSLHKAIEAIPPPDNNPSIDGDHYQVNEEILSKIPPILKDDLLSLSESFCSVPEGFSIHPKIRRLFADRLSMVKASSKTIDWGMAEYLSFASILTKGIHIRLSGQDCQRGTFSQRHAVWVDQVTAEKYFPLQHLQSSQAPMQVLNSPLSEYAVLGFDLGYSMSYPSTLTLWEAQYGDFANTAQVIIDQFISGSEQKWGLASNLTLLLPHGYEGQGPEHSSARMERYLQLAAQGNIILVNCSTPAQYFHVLRRQAFLTNKKPLVVFTPKALLRLPACTSSVDDLANGSFQEVITDPLIANPKKLLLCSGKVYYDLLQEREKRNITDVAIIRIEQLYPFPKLKLQEILRSYKGFSRLVWVQEEHSNMGASEYIRPLLQEVSGMAPEYVGRPRSAATAAGSYALHKKQFLKMMDEAYS